MKMSNGISEGIWFELTSCHLIETSADLKPYQNCFPLNCLPNNRQLIRARTEVDDQSYRHRRVMEHFKPHSSYCNKSDAIESFNKCTTSMSGLNDEPEKVTRNDVMLYDGFERATVIKPNLNVNFRNKNKSVNGYVLSSDEIEGTAKALPPPPKKKWMHHYMTGKTSTENSTTYFYVEFLERLEPFRILWSAHNELFLKYSSTCDITIHD